MDSAPLVSVVVPSFNHLAYVEACLDSIVAQTYPNIELVVIDDASTLSRASHQTEPSPVVIEATEPQGTGGETIVPVLDDVSIASSPPVGRPP